MGDARAAVRGLRHAGHARRARPEPVLGPGRGVHRDIGGSGPWCRNPPAARNAGRGYGLADMAAAIAAGTPHRASGELAFHVLDIMESILTASASGQVVELSSTVDRPDAVALSDAP